MGKKLEKIILALTIFSLVIIILGISSDNLHYKDEDNDIPNDIDNVDKNLNNKINVIGEYQVKDDKNSILHLKENGLYEIHINVCEGYLKTTGKYEIADKKLRLLNETNFDNYPSLVDNSEFSFTIIDDNTIRLDEDLGCLFQNTLFEK